MARQCIDGSVTLINYNLHTFITDCYKNIYPIGNVQNCNEKEKRGISHDANEGSIPFRTVKVLLLCMLAYSINSAPLNGIEPKLILLITSASHTYIFTCAGLSICLSVSRTTPKLFD